MSETPDYKLVTIEVETVFGKNQREDKYFTDYLEEYSIIWQLIETETPTQSGWPLMQYTGGPISLKNMLREKFGFTEEEVVSSFPQIAEVS